ncbi:plant cysteine oxidase 1-like [Hordeum vulgare subsp. vulgare]|uniref:cysteine dioxygenase n=1 Tax=Hordeum vulgare subsp. vulgare TaxID=112509 RepID=A0A8I6YML0_HORVV|nr:plant cysteine oxidase 1-like [Hordeum vulgare subsp. vulgare]
MGAGAAGLDVAAGRRRVLAAKNRAGRPRQARRRAQPPTALQRLFRACRAVFRGPGTVPAPPEVALLRAMLDRMRPEDVGLSPGMRFFRTRDNAAPGKKKNPAITHATIYKSENFSMVILFLPQNAVIPLHNHPGMTVLSKLLIGSMHVRSYDWADDPGDDPAASSPDDQLRLAELVLDDVFTAPCDTSVLYPTAGGNMHRFTAIAPCAILDILGPPYSLAEDRDCTYYEDVPCSSQHPIVTGNEQEGRRLAWLKEVEMPRDLKMCSVRYGGPPVSDR